MNELNRTAFTTERALEFLSESELTTQIGYGRKLWPLVLVKELVDNSLDACESANIPAIEISVELESDSFTVTDNGLGIKPEIIEGALDYTVRVSDKKYYVSPTRGQLGNALKCVFAAPFVIDGDRGVVDIDTRGVRHHVEITLDRVGQKPLIAHNIEAGSVKNGTSVKVYWKDVSSYRTDAGQQFYQSASLADSLIALLADYSALNPHASFTFSGMRPGAIMPLSTRHAASQPDWRKWRTDQPTSAHWYRPDDLRALIAAYISDADRPLRDFIAEFAGLSGTQVRKAVLAEAAITGSHLIDLVTGNDVDMAAVKRLLGAMRKHSTPVEPKRLGVIGRPHLEQFFESAGAALDSFNYQKTVAIDDDGLPIVAEVAFAIGPDESRLRKIIGLNWAPVFKVPSGAIANALNNCRVQYWDPVILLIHAARPRFAFADHGKGALTE